MKKLGNPMLNKESKRKKKKQETSRNEQNNLSMRGENLSTI